MKKYLSFMAFAMIAVFSTTLVSCGDDEEEIEGNGSIIGTWKGDLKLDDIPTDLHPDYYEEYHCYDYYQFKDDGTFISAIVEITKYTKYAKETFGEKDETEVEIERGTYKISGNKITMTSNGETDSGEFKVSGNKLIFTSTSGIIVSVTYSKVKDSELNQYLK